MSKNPCRKSKADPRPIPTPTPMPSTSKPLRIAGKTTPKPAAPRLAENMFVEDMTGALGLCPYREDPHCRKCQIQSMLRCTLSGLKVGTPVNICSGFDVMTSKGRHMVMEIIKEQVLMAPVCGPWAKMQNIQQDQQKGRWLNSWHAMRDIS